VPYASAVKVGLQFKRRFWEEDEAIYGGISYTDLPIRQIAYPNTGYNRSGRGVLLGAYIIEGSNSYEFTSMPPAERVARAVALGSRIHPQYGDEFENGIAVAWHRVPFTLGCAGYWTEKARAEHYATACAKSMVGSPWRASTRHTFQHGKRVLSSHRSTPSRGCTLV
jgi:monoamine oxidase